jgi:integrase
MTLTEVILGGTKRFRFAPALSPDTSLLGPLRSRIARARISPHTMRHTKAMHLLQSGVPLVMVKDFLGHVDLKSTEVYVHADLEMKRKALDLSGGLLATQPPQARLSASLIEWLESL